MKSVRRSKDLQQRQKSRTRNNADDSAEDGTETADVFFPDEVLGLILGTPLKGFHDQIGDKQERDQFQRVDSRIQQGIGEKLE